MATIKVMDTVRTALSPFKGPLSTAFHYKTQGEGNIMTRQKKQPSMWRL